MAIYNTSSDAANTAVRAFLTRIGEYYFKRSFNTGTGKSKQDWEKIRDVVFEGNCAYCGKSDTKLQIEHLIMFNREGYGLHHPGNIVPACSVCNKRLRGEDNRYKTWEEQLSIICENNRDLNSFHKRWTKIKNHVEKGEFKYPRLSSEENKAISIIANNLYDSIKNEFEQAVKLFEELDNAFTKK
jgi:HNH endonuclease